jgi:hypothetical protein
MTVRRRSHGRIRIAATLRHGAADAKRREELATDVTDAHR